MFGEITLNIIFGLKMKYKFISDIGMLKFQDKLYSFGFFETWILTRGITPLNEEHMIYHDNNAYNRISLEWNNNYKRYKHAIY